MVTETNVPEKEYDIDNPPEELPRECVGQVITSAYVNNREEAAAVDPILGDRYEGFVEAFRRDNNLTDVKCLLVRVQADDVVYEDNNEPCIFSEFVRCIDKRGRPLRQNQAPDKVATQYREVVGKSISPLAVGSPSSVVGSGVHVRFVETEIPLGRGWAKRFNLWPSEVVSAEDVAKLEVRPVERRTDSNDLEADAAATAGPSLSEDQAVAVLVDCLSGKTPAQMLETILGEPQLKTVSTVFGVSLMDVATDESLATILTEKGHMVQNGDGVLLPVSSPWAPAA